MHALVVALACLGFVACGSDERDQVVTPRVAPLDLTPGERVCFADGRMTVAPSRAASIIGAGRTSESVACGRSLHYLLNDYFIDIEVGLDIERSPEQFLARFGENGVPTSELPAAFGIRPRALRARDTRLLTVNVDHELLESDRARGLLTHDKYVVFEHNGLATHVAVSSMRRNSAGERDSSVPSSVFVEEARRRLAPWLESFFASITVVRPFVHVSSLPLSSEYEISVAHEYDGRIVHGQDGDAVELRPSYEFGAPLPCATLILSPRASDPAPVAPASGACETTTVFGNRWVLCPQLDALRPRCPTYAGSVVLGAHAFTARLSGSEAERVSLVGMVSRASRREPR